MNIFGSIVTFENNKQILHKAIVSCLKSSLVKKFYIIDNSPTNDLKALAALDNRIKYIFNHSNPGFGAAHNIAVRKSIKISAKYHLVLNPDVCFEQGVLEELFTYMENNPDVGFVMPKILYPNGEIQYLYRLLQTPFDLLVRRFLPFKKYKQKRKIIQKNRKVSNFYLLSILLKDWVTPLVKKSVIRRQTW